MSYTTHQTMEKTHKESKSNLTIYPAEVEIEKSGERIIIPPTIDVKLGDRPNTIDMQKWDEQYSPAVFQRAVLTASYKFNKAMFAEKKIVGHTLLCSPTDGNVGYFDYGNAEIGPKKIFYNRELYNHNALAFRNKITYCSEYNLDTKTLNLEKVSQGKVIVEVENHSEVTEDMLGYYQKYSSTLKLKVGDFCIQTRQFINGKLGTMSYSFTMPITLEALDKHASTLAALVKNGYLTKEELNDIRAKAVDLAIPVREEHSDDIKASGFEMPKKLHKYMTPYSLFKNNKSDLEKCLWGNKKVNANSKPLKSEQNNMESSLYLEDDKPLMPKDYCYISSPLKIEDDSVNSSCKP